MVRTINQHFNIPQESETVLPKLLARLEVGDIEPDYFAGELADELKLDREKALGISAEVKRTVLGPLKKDFSDIGTDISLLDKFQIPTIKGLSPSTAVTKTDAPKIIQDVSVAPPKPTSLPSVGWSQMAPPPAAPKATPAPASAAASASPRPTAVAMSATPKPMSAAVPTSTVSTPAAEPAPVMLHEDTTFKAAEKNAGFTLTRPGGGAEVHMGSGSSVPTPPRPAVLEFGGATKPAATSAVHYTDIKPSFSAATMANAGPRNLSQITPAPTPTTPLPTPMTAPAIPVPKPPTPAASAAPAAASFAPSSQVPQPPRPPAPATTPVTPQHASKPIVKDFL